MRWEKGKSGNLKGRPKGETLGDIYRRDKKFPKMADEVFQKLLKSKDEKIVFDTIKFMVEIRDGKAATVLSNADGTPINFSVMNFAPAKSETEKPK